MMFNLPRVWPIALLALFSNLGYAQQFSGKLLFAKMISLGF